MNGEPWKTVGEAMAWGRTFLSGASQDAARDACLLLAHVLGTPPEYLYLRPADPLDSGRAREYMNLLARRRNGEPVAYLRGITEFMGLKFAVDKRVLIPRPETEILVEEVLRFLETQGEGEPFSQGREEPSKRFTVADIGCGSGAIGLSLAKFCPSARVILTDVSEDALRVARSNADALGLQAETSGPNGETPERLLFLRGDLLDPLRSAEIRDLDVIASNLPYIPSHDMDGLPAEVRHEPALALDGGPGGLLHIARLIREAGPFVRPGGMLILEIDDGQAGEVLDLLQGSGWQDPKIVPDLAGLNRVALGFKGGK